MKGCIHKMLQGRLADMKPGPDAMIEAPRDTFSLDSCLAEQVQDVACQLGTTPAGILGFVVVVWEAIEARMPQISKHVLPRRLRRSSRTRK